MILNTRDNMYAIILPEIKSLNCYSNFSSFCKVSLISSSLNIYCQCGLWYCMSNFQLTPLKNKTDNIPRKDG